MTEVVRVAIINDDQESSHNLKVNLEFLGENPILLSSQHWVAELAADSLASKQVLCFIVGNLAGLELGELLQQIHEWDGTIPCVAMDDPDLTEVEESLRAKIVGQLECPVLYQSLLDILYKAKMYREQAAQGYESVLINENGKPMFRSLVGESTPMQKVRQMMHQVADKEVTVLITGESGTGKEVVARNLHNNSPRAAKPFVPINCGAIPADLLESELFGHEKGAFTGAITSRPGRFELANGGTLFLDEIGDMPLVMQVKLLRVLQEQSFERVGGTKTIHTDVRIIAATHNNLEEKIDQGLFRQDLYYRLNVFPIEMPSLKQRADDIPLLINELISRLERQNHASIRFNSSALLSLSRHLWPGNVRELANLVERMAIISPHGVIGVNDLPPKYQHLSDEEIETVDVPKANGEVHVGEESGGFTAPAQALLPLNGIDLKEYLSNLEKGLIEQALDDCTGVVARAADRLNIRRTTLVEKMRKYEISSKKGLDDEAG